ncbi:MAG: nucleotide exchange factor GrpE [Candidatus Parcubacteria bacterium]|nr:nucleotide exchange factor GrpE [Candidatus Parcubacteria bacterium]
MPEQTTKLDNNKEEIEKLKAQCEEYLNGWKRAKADYVNFKKEMDEKQKSFFDLANSALIMEILPVYDNLKKAVAIVPAEQSNAWVDGVKAIKKQFGDFLKQYGIEEIKTVGEKFNPEFHEAVNKEKKEDIESDIIIAEISSGYLIKGKVLAPAKVVVSE